MSAKPGYKFEDQIRKSLIKYSNRSELWWWKIADTHAYKSPVVFAGDSRLTMPKVPADFMMVLPGGYSVLLECKSTEENAPSFKFSRIKPHQLSVGIDVEALGGTYYFLINHRIARAQTCYAVNAAILAGYMRMADTQRIRWKELATIGIEVPRLPKKLWNLDPIIREVFQDKMDKKGVK